MKSLQNGKPYPIRLEADLGMRSIAIGLMIGLGVLTLGGALITPYSPSSQTPTQYNIFRVILATYTPLLTPISSAAGVRMVGGGGPQGAIPILIWLVAALATGIALRDPGRSGKAMFASASIILLLWIASVFLSAPTWPDLNSWLTEVDLLTSDLISRPIDIISLFTIPTGLAILAAQIAQLKRRPVRTETSIDEDYYL